MTVRELASEWLSWLEHVKGAKPSTLIDYRALLRDPGKAVKRGSGASRGRIVSAFGEKQPST